MNLMFTDCEVSQPVTDGSDPTRCSSKIETAALLSYPIYEIYWTRIVRNTEALAIVPSIRPHKGGKAYRLTITASGGQYIELEQFARDTSTFCQPLDPVLTFSWLYQLTVLIRPTNLSTNGLSANGVDAMPSVRRIVKVLSLLRSRHRLRTSEFCQMLRAYLTLLFRRKLSDSLPLVFSN
jgi:hypothetical protein